MSEHPDEAVIHKLRLARALLLEAVQLAVDPYPELPPERCAKIATGFWGNDY